MYSNVLVQTNEWKSRSRVFFTQKECKKDIKNRVRDRDGQNCEFDRKLLYSRME